MSRMIYVTETGIEHLSVRRVNHLEDVREKFYSHPTLCSWRCFLCPFPCRNVPKLFLFCGRLTSVQARAKQLRLKSHKQCFYTVQYGQG